MRDPVRIGNCSGFYGDRIAAAREMVEGGVGTEGIDVLCGDYLAELTMLILAKAQSKDPASGFARTFLTQMEQVLGTCSDRGIKIVANAGGLNPAGLALELRELAERLGIAVRVAHVEGDDLRGNLTAITPAVGEVTPVSANAYLGGWGIAEALGAGADVVVTGRVTDASLVVGPAAWWHGWGHTDWDRLAGAVVAGHVIECGPQATGGNYAFLDEITDRRYPGFPIAEVAADGSSVITKHVDTGGLVSIGTVTAQLLYEIGEPAYLGPDVVTHFDTVTLTQQAEHRVAITGTVGSPPPETLKVALNDVGGYRNTMTMVLTGLDLEAKSEFAQKQLFDVLGGRDSFAEVDVKLLRFDTMDAPTNDQACAHLRITVKDPDPRKVGRAFSSGIMEIALAGYAGFHTTTPPTSESAFGVYRPAAVPRSSVTQVVVLPDGKRLRIADPPTGPVPTPEVDHHAAAASPAGPTCRAPLGSVLGARSGDKGGNANIGLWARDDAGYAWAREYLSVDRLRVLLGPEAAQLRIERFELPNLRALNIVVHGLLGQGVASSTRLDAQAKGLGEYVRSRIADIPQSLVSAS
ncbi:acyclic terpene utilization AtuA family protein [Mycobacterium sp. NPDC006124]|uniref:acyclic terpene utilization AtuA family protein n=1 Tax=Mycobacterium sp. NPDC006124 TaxID=3156729 RepID=UPI0033B24557